MNPAFAADFRRYNNDRKNTGWLHILQIFFQQPGLQAITVYRLGVAIRKHKLSPWRRQLATFVYNLLQAYVQKVYDIILEPSAQIDEGFYIGHFGNIRLAHCQIGKFCNIGQSTHIIGTPEVPVIIGDFVWVGGHTKIIGCIRIGEGVTVGAGAHVERDLPANALCIGRPARVVRMGYDNRGLLGVDREAPLA